MPLPIEDYAVIGDCHTAALVGKNGSIDWLCLPRFDSDACFAALLGDDSNGRWRLAPGDGADSFAASGDWKVTRQYRGDTMVLETTFERDGNAVRITDFMPFRDKHSHLVRIVEGISGTVPMRMEIALRFGYGNVVPWVTREDGKRRCIAGHDLVVFRAPIDMHGENRTTVSNFSVRAGERLPFVLSYGNSAEPEPKAIHPEQALDRVMDAWTRWAKRATSAGRYSEAVLRSLLTLKALTYQPTGGVIAAVTTSLPEQIGGSRNWDYRFCWLRDSTFTLLALMNGGYHKEAEAWQGWLLRAIAGSPEQVQIMYAIDGDRHLMEWEVPWLSGYEGSAPVRIGNAAAEQLQLDIYGEVMDAFFHYAQTFRDHGRGSFELQCALVERLRETWHEADQGIWEARSGAQHYTYSKIMCWVAFDRAIALAEAGGHEAPLEIWRETREIIHARVCAEGFNEEVGAFTQYFGSSELDASLLLMPLVGFLPASDSRVRSTIEQIEKRLMRDGLVLRYDTEASSDGLPPGEGTFLACSFWMVSCLKLIGREADARTLFESLLALANDVGLLAEEYDPVLRRQVGNFPQAFSHIALVNAAFDLERDEGTRKRRHRHGEDVAPQSQAPVPELEPHSSGGNVGEIETQQK